MTCDTCGIAITGGTRCDECEQLLADLEDDEPNPRRSTVMTENRVVPANRIEAQAEAAARSRNGHRPPPRGLIEAAAMAMRELYANPLIALLDAEGLGARLSDGDRDAVLTLVRSLEARGPLPQREPGGTGAQPAQRL